MKILFITFMMLFIATLYAQSDIPPKADEKTDTTSTEYTRRKFMPFVVDSLDTTMTVILIHPERRPEFQYENGVVIIPQPVELNPDGVLKADPSVDLGMIYPLETRQNIILQKKLEQRQKENQLKALIEKRKKEKDEKESKKKEE